MYTKESTKKLIDDLKENKRYLADMLDDIVTEEEIEDIIKKLEGDLENA